MKNLHELTIIETIEGLKDKKFSSEEIVRDLLSRIEKLNPKLNAYVTVNKNVVDDAKKADGERSKGVSSPLLGVPLAIKDNFLTKGLRTTASAKVLDDFVPQFESTVTTRLKEAGALILGKTNMDAWAHGSSTETSDYGPTLNPWDTGRLPGGSSGGGGAAVAADICIGAIGSETAGSIRQPASWCGVTGVKPSYGRVPRYGVVAMASSTDSPGPMTKTIEDSVLLLEVIAGKDAHDATTIKEDKWEYKKGNKKPVIGIVKDYFLKDAEKGVNKTVEDAIEVLKKAGYEVREVSLLDPKFAIADYTIIQRAEVSSNLARYDGIRYGNDRTFFGQEAKRRVMIGTYVLSAGYSDQYYRNAQKVRTKIIQDFNDVFKTVDVLVAPTSPSTALPVGSTEGAAMFGELQDVLVEASSMAGLPGVSIPAGFIGGLPVGMQITGKMKDENSVIQVALDFQKLTDWHLKKPKI